MPLVMSKVERVEMKYMGSKNRIAKHILPIMLAERKTNVSVMERRVND